MKNPVAKNMHKYNRPSFVPNKREQLLDKSIEKDMAECESQAFEHFPYLDDYDLDSLDSLDSANMRV